MGKETYKIVIEIDTWNANASELLKLSNKIIKIIQKSLSSIGMYSKTNTLANVSVFKKEDN